MVEASSDWAAWSLTMFLEEVKDTILTADKMQITPITTLNSKRVNPRREARNAKRETPDAQRLIFIFLFSIYIVP